MGKGWIQPGRFWPTLAVVWGAALFALGSVVARAQIVMPLIQFTNDWRYNYSGDLGTAWRTNDYNDSIWELGPGLFQTGETTSYPAPFNTLLPPNDGRITTYFRTTFELPTDLNLAAVELFATNLVDDGCVIYLNGMETARIRMPAGTIGVNTLAVGGPATEGQFDTVVLNAALLQPGVNIVAVEVHQAGTTSSDMVWGMSLVAHVAQPLAIVRQPVGLTNLVGKAINLSVGVEGRPVSYQWRKNDANLVGATSESFAIQSAAEVHSGAYSVVVYNFTGSVTSDVAQVLILPDRIGPRVIQAVVPDTGTTNAIDLLFDSSLTVSTVNAANFGVTHLATGNPVTITAAQVSGLTVRLRMEGPHWRFFDDYFITLNNIRDARGNTIAPGTRVAVSWKVRTNVFGSSQVWQFHNSAVFDPGVYNENWWGTNYAAGDWWGEGAGVFHRLSAGLPSCWVFGSLAIDIGFQPEPYLFRTKFIRPEFARSGVTLTIKHVIDDGAVFYLNGQEVNRYNQAPGPVTASSRAATAIASPSCVTDLEITLTNLPAGENHLAVAVTQAATPGSDVVFGLVLDATYLTTLELPAEPDAVLSAGPAAGGVVQLTWPVGGYALESATHLLNPLSYPLGPWIEVSNMANPFVISTTNEPARFFRLKRK